MKKLLIGILAILIALCFAACENNPASTEKSGEGNISGETSVETDTTPSLNSNEIYQTIIDDYKSALATYDINDIENEDAFFTQHSNVNPSLIMHIARYSESGAQISFRYYDIDNNGTDELIVGASGAPAAIYSYDKTNYIPVKIFYLDTIERGSLAIYNNGVIMADGAGGAALHYYEFGKISADGKEYELLEKIEEEYIENNEVPEYRNADTRDILEYNSLDEIMDKYVSNSTAIEL